MRPPDFGGATCDRPSRAMTSRDSPRRGDIIPVRCLKAAGVPGDAPVSSPPLTLATRERTCEEGENDGVPSAQPWVCRTSLSKYVSCEELLRGCGDGATDAIDEGVR